MRGVLLLALALLVGGCATIRMSEQGGVQMVDIENTGWYLFNFIPIATGNPDHPNACRCRLFSDSVKLSSNMKLLSHALRETGADHAVNITTHASDEKVLIILLKRYAYHTSAQLIRD